MYATASLRVPQAWGQGVLGAVVHGVTTDLALRLTSGLPYTRLRNQGFGTVAPDFSGDAAEHLLASRLPWIKTLDMRLAKRAMLAGVAWTMFADVRNLLGTVNFAAAYAETGTDANDAFRSRVLAGEYDRLSLEGGSNLGADLTTVSVANCETWQNKPDCVALARVENRIGNGDGSFTRDEQERAFGAFYEPSLARGAFTARAGPPDWDSN